MILQFTDRQTWDQADLLMQPVLIRLLDNLRKVAEAQNWQATYDNELKWPDGCSDDQKAAYDHLQSQLQQTLHHGDPDLVANLEAKLANLPRPQPHYRLSLSQNDRQASFDIWQLCYQICFLNYREDSPVMIDPLLLDVDNEVDWDQLEQKTKAFILDLFAQISS